MKLCPRRPLKVPKDFGTRLAPIDPNAYILLGNTKYRPEDFHKKCKRSFRYYDTPKAMHIKYKDPQYYKNDPTYNLGKRK